MRGLRKREIRAKLAEVLKDLGCEDKELSVVLADDAWISELNERYRGKRGPTNVLSFPQEDEFIPSIAGDMLGDIVVSVETAAREAEMEGCSLESRVHRLLCHGLLHLLGYQHEGSEAEAALFFEIEEHLAGLQRVGSRGTPC
jgi:rRNA maturation RNase YbeY